MAIYEIKPTEMVELKATTFGAAQIKERGDLQRLLCQQIEIVSSETLVIAEEFGEWDDSRRRIDLLGIDRDANLVVIELKRTEDGGHMELQALRYAAMVSTMKFEDAVRVFGEHLKKHGAPGDASDLLLEFLGWEGQDDGEFASDVRIVLASAEFSRELTTAVMWLNQRDLDIRCVRLKPYSHDNRTFVDVQQLIPLPEAADYQVRVREKERQDRQERAERFDLRQSFWEELLKRAKARTSLHANTSPGAYHWIGTSAGRRGFGYNYVVRQNDASAELYIDQGDADRNKAAFDRLAALRDEIETAFGNPLKWERLDNRRGCRISYTTATGGYRDTPDVVSALQDELIDAMIRLEAVFRPRIASLSEP